MKGFNSRGVMRWRERTEVTRDECGGRSMRQKRARRRTVDLHVLPQDFVGTSRMASERVGMTAPLEGQRARDHGSCRQRRTSGLREPAGVAVAATLSSAAAAEAVLTPDEKELGVAMVDIGGGTADLAIFERGSLWHTGVVAIGGDHFTNDIAVGLRTPIPDAEKVKRKNGCALSSMVDEDETIEVASVGGRKPRLMPRRILSEILQPRAEESSTSCGTRFGAPATRSRQLRNRAHRRWRDSRRHAGNRGTDFRSADRRGSPVGGAGWPITSTARCSPRRSSRALCAP